MKLRNKDDGRIREFGIDETKSFPYYLRDELGNTYRAKTLKEIADKWEEIEEPKEYWFIAGRGDVEHSLDRGDIYDIKHKKMGNYFKTKEEAEKVVKKLRAWRRLKACGFKFTYWDRTSRNGDAELSILASVKEYMGFTEDLNLLFGGEE